MKLYEVVLSNGKDMLVQAKNITECMELSKALSGGEFRQATIIECEQPEKIGQTFYNAQ